MCAKALRPDPTDPTVPSVAAVCVYGDMAPVARAVVGDNLHVAAVATAFQVAARALKSNCKTSVTRLPAGPTKSTW